MVTSASTTVAANTSASTTVSTLDVGPDDYFTDDTLADIDKTIALHNANRSNSVITNTSVGSLEISITV